MQNFSKPHHEIEQGALFRRSVGGSMSEIAEVVEIGRDRMGIPHVRFNVHLIRDEYAMPDFEQRTLSLESFHARYKERVRVKGAPADNTEN